MFDSLSTQFDIHMTGIASASHRKDPILQIIKGIGKITMTAVVTPLTDNSLIMLIIVGLNALPVTICIANDMNNNDYTNRGTQC